MVKMAPCAVDTVVRVRMVGAAVILVTVFNISAYAQSAAPSAPRGAVICSGQVQTARDFWRSWPPKMLAYSDTEWSAHWFLKELGCEQGFMAFVTRLFFHPVGFILLVSIITLAPLLRNFRLPRRKQLHLSTGIVAASVLLAAFQWHASLEQDAMQRFEGEISNANTAETSPAVASMLPDLYKGCEPDYAQERFVYIHLDNLEYALERYREGFASATTTARAIMTFAVHCRESVFRNYASEQMMGYSPLVKRVAGAIIYRIDLGSIAAHPDLSHEKRTTESRH
jgi:hypothetical protein